MMPTVAGCVDNEIVASFVGKSEEDEQYCT